MPPKRTRRPKNPHIAPVLSSHELPDRRRELHDSHQIGTNSTTKLRCRKRESDSEPDDRRDALEKIGVSLGTKSTCKHLLNLLDKRIRRKTPRLSTQSQPVPSKQDLQTPTTAVLNPGNQLDTTSILLPLDQDIEDNQFDNTQLTLPSRLTSTSSPSNEIQHHEKSKSKSASSPIRKPEDELTKDQDNRTGNVDYNQFDNTQLVNMLKMVGLDTSGLARSELLDNCRTYNGLSKVH
ncbi:uncharacterized protein MELLADRAFT_63997 [Melampsora larici-populina 98AG31]|uniref:Uncharacterized protein n=1 Tax=Melampsora larici-populina (strain 98AG31 / pathotype 3-4-7) TaxID=747676 RepID=F4RPS5_MELLP|nr:uncharacterized protein MELLADRAFT_63997 [Melampsora larici-populina 98AG31]EGG05597.1 hypothetical protein MELLADRAFT_63997 [Melampsora larici-populina 98AG31]